ncbi:response regulator [Salipiger sp. IMCC34102]|uniref:response regulator n=1 Tax=Salipiger sp. IMCC34102 TaxID=2510647 RepID=UPI00101C124D|nr:response regulator [Salipiger sp. IMCC34102]RYH02014.1 response regulator [Salipiger sp. IMCC34102]
MTRKIIAIDDSEIARDLVVATLAKFGFDDVETFEDPLAALESLSGPEQTADLVLLDIMMPGMDGIELCARLRQLAQWRDVPIVMLTSRSDKESLSRAFMAGANDYLTKPFDHIEFQARLKSQLRLKSELDRRKIAPPARFVRDLPEAQEAAHRPFVGNRDTLLTALTSLKPQSMLSIYVMSIDALAHDTVDFSPPEREAVLQKVAHALAGILQPASDILVHWEDEAFCGVSLRHDARTMRRQLEQIQSDVQNVLIGLGNRMKGAPPTVSITLASSASQTPSKIMGDAFRALETIRPEDRGKIWVVGQE